MLGTPDKLNESNISNTSALTPVRFLDSPGARSPNVLNLPEATSRLEVIIKTLQNNYSKWKLADKRGFAICHGIEAIKTRVLAAQNNSNAVPLDATLYPDELKPYCDKLALLVSIFVDIKANAQQSVGQLRSLRKLPGCSNTIFYRSWQMQQFLDFTECLADRYLKECEVKRKVMEELPHCTERAQLIRHTTAWEYPQYVDESVALMFKFLSEEINLSKR